MKPLKPKQRKRNYHLIRKVTVSRVYFPTRLTAAEAVKLLETSDAAILAGLGVLTESDVAPATYSLA